MIPNWRNFLAFVWAQLCVTVVACYAISKVSGDAASQALVATIYLLLAAVAGPLAIYVTGKAWDMTQRRKDPSTMAEQITAEAAAMRAPVVADGGTVHPFGGGSDGGSSSGSGGPKL